MCFFCLFVFCNFLSNNLTITNFPCSSLLLFFFFLKPFPLPEDGNKTLITFGCYLSFLPLLPPLSLPLSKPALRFQLFMGWERHITRRGSKSDCRNPDSLEFIGSITSWSRARQLGCAAPQVWMHSSPSTKRSAAGHTSEPCLAGCRARAGGKRKKQSSSTLLLQISYHWLEEKVQPISSSLSMKLLIFPILSLVFLPIPAKNSVCWNRAYRLFNFIWNSLTILSILSSLLFVFSCTFLFQPNLVPTSCSLSLPSVPPFQYPQEVSPTYFSSSYFPPFPCL